MSTAVDRTSTANTKMKKGHEMISGDWGEAAEKNFEEKNVFP